MEGFLNSFWGFKPWCLVICFMILGINIVHVKGSGCDVKGGGVQIQDLPVQKVNMIVASVHSTSEPGFKIQRSGKNPAEPEKAKILQDALKLDKGTGDSWDLKLNKTVNLDKYKFENFECVFTCGPKSTYNAIIFFNYHNTYPPKINGKNGKFSIGVNETTPKGTVVFALKDHITDDDYWSGNIPSIYKYSIQPKGPFIIDKDNGNVILKGLIDYESNNKVYNYKITVKDFGDNEYQPTYQTATTSLEIKILDEDDQSPELTTKFFEVNIYENVRKDSIYKIEPKVEAIANSPVTTSIIYKIIDKPKYFDNYFKFLNKSGEIKVIDSLDTIPKSKINLKIKAYRVDRPLDKFDIGYLTINIFGLNKNPPEMEKSSYKVSVRENSIPTLLLQIKATDKDGNELEYQRSMSFKGISLNESNGLIKLTEHKDPQTIKFQVWAIEKNTEKRYTSHKSDVTIEITDENDHSPEFDQKEYEFSMSQSIPNNHEIGKVVAKDDDQGSNGGPNGEIKFHLRGNPDEIIIEEKSGTLRKKSSHLINSGKYIFMAIATDQAKKPRSGFAIVKVTVLKENLNPPTFPNVIKSQIAILESMPVGTSILDVTAKDDDGDFLKYSIVPDKPFGIKSSTSGCAFLYLKEELDTEKKESYSLTISASDPIYTALHKLQVNVQGVNDNYPKFKNPSYAFNVLENSAKGKSVGKIEATDSDVNPKETVHYSLGDNSNFEIDATSGEIKTKRIFDILEPTKMSFFAFASDNGNPNNLTERCLVTVNIVDINNHVPEFSVPSVQLTVQEDKMNSLIYQLHATDKDVEKKNKFISYEIQNSKSSYFELRNKNELYLKTGQESKVLERTISVIVETFNPGQSQKRNSINISVTFKDINNKVPHIDQDTYRKSIPEDSPIGSTIFTIKAKDTDIAKENKKTEFFIDGWTQKNPFFINAITGEILLWKTLDADGTQDKTFSFKVIAKNSREMDQSDNGKIFSEAQVEIKIINVNDNPPKFIHDVILHSVKETETKGHTLFKITATDGDNDQITYFLKGNGPFDINPSTGEFSLSGGLSHERKPMYHTQVIATDNGKPPKSGSTMVVILVQSVNKAPIVKDGMTFSILEEQPKGTNVGCIQASDPDGDTLVYSMTSTDFSVDSATGEIKSQIVLDYEKKNHYEIYIEVADHNHAVTKPVTINVKDTNDHDPLFSPSEYKTNLEKFTKGSKVIQLTAKDDDKNDKLTYSLTGDSDFEIDQTGKIQLSKDIDWNTKENSISLMASVNDIKNSSASALVSIHLVKPLEFAKKVFTTSIPEDAKIGTTVFKFEPCNFVDRTETIHNLEIDLLNENEFIYDKTCGCILTNVELDRETEETHLIKMKLKNQNVNYQAELKINIEDINDESPTLAPVKNVIELYDDTKPGTVIIQINATDKDEGDGFTYFLEETYGKFVIDAHSGVIKTRDRLNYRLKPNYDLIVVVMDYGSPPHESKQTVRLKISDGNRHTPTFDQQIYHLKVDESTTRGIEIGKLSVNDYDHGANGQLSFCIISGNIDGAFTISNGSVQVNNSKALDYEKTKMFNLSVEVSDMGINPKSSETTVLVQLEDINDNSPVFKSPEYVSKHLPIPKNEIIFTVHAVDADSNKNGYNDIRYFQVNNLKTFYTGTKTGEVKSLSELKDVKMFAVEFRACDLGNKCTKKTVRLSTYSDVPDILPVNEGIKNALVVDINATDGDLNVFYTLVSCNDYFTINSSTGIVRTKIPLVWDPQNDQFPITVVAQNTKIKSNHTEIHITVQVIDVNDHDPEFSQKTYLYQVEENSVKSFPIQATDKDNGQNANITYSFDSTEPNVAEGSISLNPQTGVLTISYLNREDKNKYTFDIKAEDKGDPPRFSKATVTLEVLDINDNAPVFTENEYKKSIEESRKPQKVLRVHADDADDGLNKLVYYELKDKSVPFTINQITGEIWSMEGLDFEENSMYRFQVLATDHGNIPKNSSCDVFINVIDICDEVPQLSTIIPIYKDTAEGTPVFSLMSSENGTNYNISAEHNILAINEKTGNVITNSKIPQTVNNKYHMTVTAWGHCNLPVYTQFEIKPEDPLPILSGKKLKAEMTENNCAKEGIYNLSSIKGFEGKDVIFELKTWTDYFKIENGQIYCQKEVDREEHSKFILRIDVIFKKSPITYTADESLEIVVAVKDVNDNPPRFKFPSLFYSIPSTAEFYYLVGKIQVIDEDADENGASQFSLSGPDKDAFYINPSTGELHTLFDATKKAEFNLNVKAVDQNGKGIAATVPLKASVYDNNFNLEMNIDRPVDFMEKILHSFIGNLSTILELEIVLDRVQVHQDPSRKLDLKRTDILFHALDFKNQKLVSKQTLQSKMDAKKEAIENLLHQLGMQTINIEHVSNKPEKTSVKTSNSQVIIIILACIIFIGCFMGIIMTVVFTRRQQKKVRELKAAANFSQNGFQGISNNTFDNVNEYSQELNVVHENPSATHSQNGNIPNQIKAEDNISLQEETTPVKNTNEPEAKDGYPSISKANQDSVRNSSPSTSSPENDKDGLETGAKEKAPPALPTTYSSKNMSSVSDSSDSLKDAPIIIPNPRDTSMKQNGDLENSDVEEPVENMFIQLDDDDDDPYDLITEL